MANITENLGSTFLDNASGILGNVAKAVLIFPDIRPEKIEKEEVNGKNKTVGIFDNVFENTGDFDFRNALASFNITAKKFEVQFNPSTLKIDAYGGGRQKVSSNVENRLTVNYQDVNPYINVSFTMVFDDTNNADAFAVDKFSLSASNLAKNAATAANTIMENEYTVRPQVEGFLAAIRNEAYRMVIFQWGNMRYTGMINNINAQYKMFNAVGNPIRAEVYMNILVTNTTTVEHVNYWKNRYKEILEKLSYNSFHGESKVAAELYNTVK